MLALKAKWLPTLESNEETLAQALYLEKNYQEQMQIAVNNGICMAFDES